MGNPQDDRDGGAAEPSLPKPAPKPDQIGAAIGEVGKWQCLKILVVFLASAPGLSHIFNSAFIAPKVAYWCNKSMTEDFNEYGNVSLGTFSEKAVDNGGIDFFNDTGKKYENGTKIVVAPLSYYSVCDLTCTEYVYDHSFWTSTIITDFDLVCGKSALPYLAKSIIFSGLALGSFVSGLVSDRFGRKKAIWFSSVTMLAAGLLTSIMPWYPAFVFFWLITGTMAISCYTAAFVWTMELATGKWKIYLGMAMNYSWPTCRLIIAGLTYGLRDWRWVLRAISALVAFGSVILFWLPESPRWLIAKGRIPEAQQILSDARKFNGDPIEPEQIELQKPKAPAGQKPGSFFDIAKHPILRWQVLIMYFNWFTTALIMYGLALSWKELTGGLYLNFIIGTILDFPAKTLAMMMTLKVGRKYPYMAGSAITGTMFLITIFIPRDVYPGNWPIVVLALIGNFCTTMCFAILYMYSGELMPTTVRAAGVGSCSLVSKVGGVMSTTVAALADYHVVIPNILFASLALTSAALTIMVPETKGRPMPETLDDVDRKHFFEKRRRN